MKGVSMNTLSNRSGREYPHNAIYEILTMRMDEEDINEPKEYALPTRRAFDKLMREVRKEVKDCYRAVFRDGKTLVEAGRALGVSCTTVRNRLNEVYTVRCSTGFVVNELSNTSKAYSDAWTKSIENISKWLKFAIEPSAHRKVGDILIAYISGVDVDVLAELHSMSADDINSYIHDYNKFVQGE